jgi:phosphoribosylamine--glycine ligase
VYGPSAAAALIEGSKSFAKEVLESAGVPTATTLPAPVAPCVVKADGLAAGKGVFVCHTQDEADVALGRARAFGETVVVEELLEGEEASVFVATDGESVAVLPSAQDYKRIGDGDTGPNTGGMGAYSPVPGLRSAEVDELVDRVHKPVLAELSRRGTPFVGTLYAGLMLTAGGPKVLEFNCRFGDPETQAILPLLESDLLELLAAAATGDLAGVETTVSPRCAVTVVLASKGYPESIEVGVEIAGIDEAESLGALVFHAGTALREGTLLTAGGRVLDVTAVADTHADARAKAYEAVERVHFAGAQFRRDIALKAAHVPA